MKSSSRRFAFNIIDFLLILVILAAISAMVYLIANPQSAENQDKTQTVMLEYQITVPSLREEFQGKAGIGDTLRDSLTGMPLGEIVDITYAAAMHHGINQLTGETVSTPKAGYLTMTLTVRTEADRKDGFLAVDETEMQMGKQISFLLPNLTASGYLSAMTATEANLGKEAGK